MLQDNKPFSKMLEFKQSTHDVSSTVKGATRGKESRQFSLITYIAVPGNASESYVDHAVAKNDFNHDYGALLANCQTYVLNPLVLTCGCLSYSAFKLNQV